MDDDGLISAVIIDDHEVVVAGVEVWCSNATPPIRLIDVGDRVAAAWTGPGAAADVVILDLQLAPRAAQQFTGLRRLVEAGRRVVVFTQDAERTTAVRCITLGALAYVAKSEGKDHLVAAVRAAARGEQYTPPSLSGAIVDDNDPDRPQLTPMEIKSLRAWFASSSKNLAAGMLKISVKTLDTYIARARDKYDAKGRSARTKTALATRALEDGLVTLDDLNDEPGPPFLSATGRA